MIKKILIILALLTIVPSITGGVVSKRINNSAITTLLNTNWVFTGYSYRPSSTLTLTNVIFMSNDTRYTTISFSSSGGIGYFNSSTNTWELVIAGGNINRPELAYISFIGGSGLTNTQLITLMQNNATQMGVDV